MMVADVKPPLTNDELLALINVDGFYRFPASIDDYWNLLSEAQYRADYYDYHVIATMSYESDIHSRIATEFSILLGLIYRNKPGFLMYNSNRPLYVETYSGAGTGRSAGAGFNADGMVVLMPRNPHEYRPGLGAETTPVLLIEVLSPSTRAYDFGTKLPAYKQIPSLQTILYVEQDKPDILVMERQAPNRWTETRLQAADESFLIAGQPVTLEQIYRAFMCR
ncbi:Uma2 family endonuclease [Spirosoma arcticum]